mmetsp:Transcript_17953/g.41253  ORF Transcript_17953/g.41253 Transcript_17953/m.41253 type:complete len:202 (-) Transcript_17953:207-812(-)
MQPRDAAVECGGGAWSDGHHDREHGEPAADSDDRVCAAPYLHQHDARHHGERDGHRRDLPFFFRERGTPHSVQHHVHLWSAGFSLVGESLLRRPHPLRRLQPKRVPSRRLLKHPCVGRRARQLLQLWGDRARAGHWHLADCNGLCLLRQLARLRRLPSDRASAGCLSGRCIHESRSTLSRLLYHQKQQAPVPERASELLFR